MTEYIKIFGVIIAGLLALFQAKLNIISNSRIKRIEVLRELISDYCMEVMHLVDLKGYLFEERDLSGLDEKVHQNLLSEHVKSFDHSKNKINKIQTKILLFLEYKHENEKELKKIMVQNNSLIDDSDNLGKSKIANNVNKLVKESTELFVKELNKSSKFLFFKL